MSLKGYIYITIPKSNNWCYIGKRTKSVFDTNYVGSGKVIKDYLKKHNKTDLHCSILEWCTSEEDLNDAEKAWITLFKEECGDFCKNISSGGVGGDNFTNNPNKELIRENIRKLCSTDEYKIKHLEGIKNANQKEETHNNRRNAQLGKKKSAETIQKMREAKIGKSKKKFYWLTPDGEIKEMAMNTAILWHKDWTFIGPSIDKI